jgi:hypothetical protein
MRARWIPGVAALLVVVAVSVVVRATPEGAGATAKTAVLGTSEVKDSGRTSPTLADRGQTWAALDGDTAISPPPEQFDAPGDEAAPPGELADASTRFPNVVPGGGTWAVMIGINDYPGSRYDLRSAVADAHDVNEALAGMSVPADHRLTITNKQATAANIKLAADWLVAHAGPDAVAVFFYAGHVRKLTNRTEAIIGADGKAVTDAELAAHLNGLKARRAWIGMAACYGGGFTELVAPGRILSAAAPANRLAYENAAFGRSYMVQFMVREAMIDNRAPASIQDSFAYARSAIAQKYPGREPVQIEGGEMGPLSLRPPGAGPPPPAQPKSAPSQQPPPPPADRQPQQQPPATDPNDSDPGAGSGSGGSNCKGVSIGVIRCK